MDIEKILLGSACWVAAYFVALISQYLFPAIISIVDGMSTTIGQLCWAAVILFWGLIMLAAPLGLIITGLRTSDTTTDDKLMTIVFAFGYSFFFMALGYFGNTFLATMSTAFNASNGNTPFLLTLFWVSTIALFAMNIVVIPVTVIVDAKKTPSIIGEG